MSLSVAYTNEFGIDRQALKDVTREIFKRAEAKSAASVAQTANQIAFDLYSGKTSMETAKQIVMSNSGLQITLSNNLSETIRFLNTQAAKKTVVKKTNFDKVVKIQYSQEDKNENNQNNNSHNPFKSNALNEIEEFEIDANAKNIFA